MENTQDNYLRALIYGESGVGKTVLGATADNPLFLCTEKGLKSLKGLYRNKKTGDVSYTGGEGFEPLETPKHFYLGDYDEKNDCYRVIGKMKLIAAALRQKKIEQKTIIVDNLTDLGQMIESELSADADRDGMGIDLRSKFTKVFTSFLMALRDCDYHVVFLAHEREIYDKKGNLTGTKVLFSGKGGLMALLGKMDLVARLTFDGKTRKLSLGDGQTKNRINELGQDLGLSLKRIIDIVSGDVKDFGEEIDLSDVVSVDTIVEEFGEDKVKLMKERLEKNGYQVVYDSIQSNQTLSKHEKEHFIELLNKVSKII